MDSQLNSNTHVRSLVRPVSPLSRFQKFSLPKINRLADLSSPHQDRDRSPLSRLTKDENRRIIMRRGPGESEGDLDQSQSLFGLKSGKKYFKDSWRRRQMKRLDKRALKEPIYARIDRSLACPILVRLFYSTNARHYSLSDYKYGRIPENEIQFSTWIDATLKELANEVRFVCRAARRRGTRLQFAIVYPNSRGSYGRRQLGVVISGYGIQTNVENNDAKDKDPNRGGALTDDSDVTLMSKRFQIGDYIDCAIVEYVPGSLAGWNTGRRPLGPTSKNNENNELFKDDKFPRI